MNNKNDKEDIIKHDADKNLVPVIIADEIGWVLSTILACMIIIKVSDFTRTSGTL